MSKASTKATDRQALQVIGTVIPGVLELSDEAVLLMQETLRMYPPVGIGQVRISNSHDITLADRLHIPAGTCIWVPHHAIQNASFNWDDPEKFMPGVLGLS